MTYLENPLLLFTICRSLETQEGACPVAPESLEQPFLFLTEETTGLGQAELNGSETMNIKPTLIFAHQLDIFIGQVGIELI